jgi:4-amino-4-deoxy-L-arabinose transferase-like glycosyltransferase
MVPKSPEVMSSADAPNPAKADKLLIQYGLTAALAILSYWLSLGSEHILKSTDELPYVHITRQTAASGHLLPLRSEIAGVRNTKPPLLFWQGIVSTNWGQNWTLWHLRYPSVIYTLLTGWLVFLLGRKLSGQVTTGLLAFLVFLAFFSTYRYGRPFLTDPPIVFWLFLPFFAMLYWQPASFESRVLALMLGIVVGLGVVYKSLALAAPVLAGLAWWFWHKRDYHFSTFVLRDAWKLAVIGCTALSMFSLWFIFDPEPKAIWNEFVLRENLAKIHTSGAGYVAKFLWGGDSVWRMLAAFPVNAGLLAFPILALFYLAYKHRSGMGEGQKLLWMCVLTYLVAFTAPSQRSERYLLPAMPALAVLTALNWDRFHRHVLGASIVAAGVLIGVLAYLSLCLQAGVAPARCYPLLYWVGLGFTGILVLTVLFVPRMVRSSVLMVVFAVYLCFSGFMWPLDGMIGTYSPEVQQGVRGREVWVPVKYNARAEGYRFLLPGADIHAYNYEQGLTVDDLSAKYPLFVVRLPVNDGERFSGKILGRRLDLGSVRNLTQIIETVNGKMYDRLFLKELLIERAGVGGQANGPR